VYHPEPKTIEDDLRTVYQMATECCRKLIEYHRAFSLVGLEEKMVGIPFDSLEMTLRGTVAMGETIGMLSSGALEPKALCGWLERYNYGLRELEPGAEIDRDQSLCPRTFFEFKRGALPDSAARAASGSKVATPDPHMAQVILMLEMMGEIEETKKMVNRKKRNN
jgi:hypothetical protein